MTNYNQQNFEESLLRLLSTTENESYILYGLVSVCEEIFLSEELGRIQHDKHRKALHIGEMLRTMREVLKEAANIRSNMPANLKSRLKEMLE